MALNVGDKAPDFTLKSFTPSEDVKEISLSDYAGKNLVTLFFPQAFTGGCTEELCTISENINDYISDDTNVIGISVDGTFVQKAFAKANNIPYPLLSDFNKEVIKKYDVVQEDFVHGMKQVSQRAVYIVDKDGKIKYVEVTENPGVGIKYDKLKEALQS